MVKIIFRPLDTLFFRDGSPYNRQELQSNICTIFPPSPTTLIGAIRAAWARSMKWRDGERWDKNIQSRLGSGFNLPEGVSFDGPYLFRNSEPLFPAPAHLLGILPDKPEENEKPRKLLLLSPCHQMETDLGNVQIPDIQNSADLEGHKVLTDEWWITASGLKQILLGIVPDCETLVYCNNLWQVEHRTGNFRDPATRTTGLMSLYAPQHIRLHHNVSLVMYAEGLPEEHHYAVQQQPAPVGGEARICTLTIETGHLSSLLNISEPKSSEQYLLIALTPVQLGSSPRPGLTIGDGKLQSACNPLPVMLGGWDRDKPRKLVPCLRPGSVLFLQSEQAHRMHEIIKHGNNPQWGFGRFISGVSL